METAGPDVSDEYHGHRLLIFTAFFIPVQIFSVVLRQLARHLVKAAWGLEDIVIYAALTVQMVFAGIAISALPIP